MKSKIIAAAVAVTWGCAANNASAITLTFTVNPEGDNAAFPAFDPANSVAFGIPHGVANPDYRIVSGGFISGGGEKRIAPGVSWSFDDATGKLTAVTGSDITPGCSYYCTTNGGTTSAQSAGGTGLFKSSFYGGLSYGFLAPTAGSAAGHAYGEGVLSGDIDGNGVFSVYFPVLEAQWAGGIFTIGLTNGGVTFNCSSAAGVFGCQAERQFDYNDDTHGFAGQYAQWDVTGTMPVAAVPVPAAGWLFVSGLAGMAGIARRDKSCLQIIGST